MSLRSGLLVAATVFAIPCPEGMAQVPLPGVFIVDPQPGFPVVNGSSKPPSFVDLGNGEKAVLTSGGNIIGLYDQDGIALPGWPIDIELSGMPGPMSSVTSALVGDLTGDGVPEIVYTSWFPPSTLPGHQWLMALDTLGSVVPGWPVSVKSQRSNLNTHWCLGDVDGDGDYEVVWTTHEREPDRRVEVYQGDGSLLPGFPAPISLPPGYENGLHDLSAIAAGDLDGDGKDEVVVTYISGETFMFYPSPLFIIDDSGSQTSTWLSQSAGGGGYLDEVLIADLDLDGTNELIATGPNRVYWYDSQGAAHAPWLLVPDVAEIALADFDDDGDRELLIFGPTLRLVEPELGVVHTHSDPQYSWFLNAAVGDVNGDGSTEILVTARTTDDPSDAVFAVDLHVLMFDSELNQIGVTLLSVPVTGGSSGTSIAIDDLDGDGDMECAFFMAGPQRTEVYSLPNLFGGEVTVQFSGEFGDPTLSRYIGRGVTPPPRFLRGDTDQNGVVGIGDAIGILNHLFLGYGHLCPHAMDVNGDGNLQIDDPIYALSYLFAGGPPPATPGWPDCQADDPGQIPCSWTICP